MRLFIGGIGVTHQPPASDKDLADWLIGKITDPNVTQLDLWIREAERAIQNMTDQEAKDRLQQTVDQYRHK